MNPQQNPRHAFTIVELLVVIAIIAVLVALQIPALAASKAGVQRIYCSNNLKQVGIAFRTWAGKNAGRMPAQVAANQGGAASAIGFRATGATFSQNMPAGGPLGVFGMYCVMSNELNTPKILYCPSEYRASVFQGYIFGNTSGINPGCFSDNQISYFIGVDAVDISPSMFLAGDSNIGDGATPPTAANTYSEPFSSRKFVALGTNVVWTATNPNWADNQHAKRGNVAFVDGSVQTLNTEQLRLSLNRSGDSDRALANNFVKANSTSSTSKNRLQFP